METYFEEVYETFLSKITSYDYLNFTEEELNEELKVCLKSALSRFISKKNLIPNYDMECFNRPLDELEIEILSLGMIVSWLAPQINSIELLKPVMSSKDFTVYSQANHLSELRGIKSDADKDFQYWVGRYDLNKLVRNGIK